MRRDTAALLSVLVLAAGCRAFEPDFGSFDIPEVRSLRDRAAQHDALVELRLEELLPVAMDEAGVDCWLVVSGPVDPDPVFVWLTRSGTEVRGRVVLSLCRQEGGVVRRAYGRGLEALDALYEVEPAAEGAVDAALKDDLEARDPDVIVVNRAPAQPWADGLGATDSDWLEAALGPALWSRVGSAAPLVQGFLGRHLDSEATLFAETARLTDAILHEVLSDREVVAAGTSLADLRWAFRNRAAQRSVEVTVGPRAAIWRPGEMLSPQGQTAPDLLLQPGDLVLLTAGIRYLDYGVHMARWAYLLPDGELEPPSWMAEALEARAADLEAALELLAPGVPGARLAAELQELARARQLSTVRVGRLGRLLDPWSADEPGKGLPWSLDAPLPAPGPLVLEASGTVWPPDQDGQQMELSLREAVWVGPQGARPVIPFQRSPYLID